jgi:hypothetical protein
MPRSRPETPPAARRRFTRREWLLLAFGLLVWAAIATGAAWFVHALSTRHDDCAKPCDTPSTASHGTARIRDRLGQLGGNDCGCGRE